MLPRKRLLLVVLVDIVTLAWWKSRTSIQGGVSILWERQAKAMLMHISEKISTGQGTTLPQED